MGLKKLLAHTILAAGLTVGAMGCSYGTTSKQPTRNIPSHCEDRERASTKLECDYLEQFMKDSQGNNMDASKFNSINLCRKFIIVISEFFVSFIKFSYFMFNIGANLIFCQDL